LLDFTVDAKLQKRETGSAGFQEQGGGQRKKNTKGKKQKNKKDRNSGRAALGHRSIHSASALAHKCSGA